MNNDDIIPSAQSLRAQSGPWAWEACSSYKFLPDIADLGKA